MAQIWVFFNEPSLLVNLIIFSGAIYLIVSQIINFFRHPVA